MSWCFTFIIIIIDAYYNIWQFSQTIKKTSVTIMKRILIIHTDIRVLTHFLLLLLRNTQTHTQFMMQHLNGPVRRANLRILFFFFCCFFEYFFFNFCLPSMEIVLCAFVVWPQSVPIMWNMHWFCFVQFNRNTRR